MGSGLHLCGGPVETPVLLSCSQRSLDRVWIRDTQHRLLLW